MTALRFLVKPCDFIAKISNYIMLSSVMVREVNLILENKYQIDSLIENYKDAITARIWFVQNREPQMREPVLHSS